LAVSSERLGKETPDVASCTCDQNRSRSRHGGILGVSLLSQRRIGAFGSEPLPGHLTALPGTWATVSRCLMARFRATATL
jgi:hypothetical protein